jgi:alpha-beta hydrolase superfamily lysophospholipase
LHAAVKKAAMSKASVVRNMIRSLISKCLPARCKPHSRWVRVLVLGAASSVILAGGCAELAQKERELVFRIEPGNASWYTGLPAEVQEMDVPVGPPERGQRIHAWWWPAQKRDAPALLYLHGSRWNLTGQLFRIARLHELGFSVLAIDYRGFGKSKGDLPSEETVYEDSYTAWERLVALQPDPSRRFIYGHSLGGAVAVELAQRLTRETGGDRAPAGGLIVEASFTTLADAADAVANTVFPVRWLLSQRFDSLDKIGHVRVPVLFVHGTADRYIPARFSEALYAAATAPKKLLLIEGGTHNNSIRIGGSEYRQALRELFGLAP